MRLMYLKPIMDVMYEDIKKKEIKKSIVKIRKPIR